MRSGAAEIATQQQTDRSGMRSGCRGQAAESMPKGGTQAAAEATDAGMRRDEGHVARESRPRSRTRRRPSSARARAARFRSPPRRAYPRRDRTRPLSRGRAPCERLPSRGVRGVRGGASTRFDGFGSDGFSFCGFGRRRFRRLRRGGFSAAWVRVPLPGDTARCKTSRWS